MFMKRIALSLTLILALLFSVVAGIQLVNLTQAHTLPELPTPIYIREDGTIEGAEGAIQKIENTYAFVRDINKTIEIHKDNITLEGNGFTLTKPPEVNITGNIMPPVAWFPSIQIHNRENIIIRNIVFDGCYTGIKVGYSSNITIIQNSITAANWGIDMTSCVNCSIIGNHITDSWAGLHLGDSSYLNIAYNNISGNHGYGGWITIGYSNISRNDFCYTVWTNGGIGLYCYATNSYNYIFENNFIDNNEGLIFQLGSNTTLSHNYWSNYQRDFGGGIVDQSPLRSPISTSFEPSLFPVDFLGPAILVLSPANKTYDESSIPLNFTVNEAVTQIRHVLDGEEDVVISGNTSLTGLPNGNYSLIVYAKDQAGNIGVSKLIYFSVEVPEPFPTLLVIAITILVVAIVAVSLLVYFKKNKR